MAWVAEILRKEHRICAQCRLAPTHVYDPDLTGADDALGEPVGERSGTPLCNACLASRLIEDFTSFTSRGLLFEPALGPEAIIFHPLGGPAARAWPEQRRDHVRARLDSLKDRCDTCGQHGRFLWVPVDSDANLWPDDWLASLEAGDLAPADTLCCACAATRLARSIEERGLFYEAIVPPRGGDGVLFGSEI